jgi:hypothetical protein
MSAAPARDLDSDGLAESGGFSGVKHAIPGRSAAPACSVAFETLHWSLHDDDFCTSD